MMYLAASDSDRVHEEEDQVSMVTIRAADTEDVLSERLAASIRRLNKYEEDFLAAKIQVARDEVAKAEKYLESLIAEREQKLQRQLYQQAANAEQQPCRGYRTNQRFVLVLVFLLLATAIAGVCYGKEIEDFVSAQQKRKVRSALKENKLKHPSYRPDPSIVEQARIELDKSYEKIRQQQQQQEEIRQERSRPE